MICPYPNIEPFTAFCGLGLPLRVLNLVDPEPSFLCTLPLEAVKLMLRVYSIVSASALRALVVLVFSYSAYFSEIKLSPENMTLHFSHYPIFM